MSPSWQLEEKVEVEYVSEKPAFEDANGNLNPLMQDLMRVFDKFTAAEDMFPIATKVLFQPFLCSVRINCEDILSLLAQSLAAEAVWFLCLKE